MPHLLVTGFGPFPTMPRNPSAGLARTVAASPRLRLLGTEARCLVLTTAYRSLGRELRPALTEAPTAVLMIGVAGRSKPVRVECRATARRSTLFPDVEGEASSGPGSRRSVQERRTSLPPVKALLRLRQRGLPSRISRDAGRYLCNAAYFDALAQPVPVLFIHIPKPPRTGRAAWDSRLAAALVEIALTLATLARVAAPPRLR